LKEFLAGKGKVLADLHDERTNKRLLVKGSESSIATNQSSLISRQRTSSAFRL